VDRIDILSLHNPGRESVEKGEVYQVLDKAKQAGKIGWAGISADPEVAQWCINRWPFDVLIIQYSMAKRLAEEAVLPAAGAKDLGVLNIIPLVKWIFDWDGPPKSSWQRQLWDLGLSARLNEWFARHPDYTKAELLLRFVLARPEIHCPVVATKNPDHLAANVAAAEKGPLPDEIMRDFREWVQACE
jgi:aryl-alcohol dehydrogenase-like predicted oxidoreductase